MPLRSALDRLLPDLGLTWVIVDEVLLITTSAEAQNRMAVKVYDVADLVQCRDEKGEPWEDYEMLASIIRTCVQPTTWDEVGGAEHCRRRDVWNSQSPCHLTNYGMFTRRLSSCSNIFARLSARCPATENRPFGRDPNLDFGRVGRAQRAPTNSSLTRSELRFGPDPSPALRMTRTLPGRERLPEHPFPDLRQLLFQCGFGYQPSHRRFLF